MIKIVLKTIILGGSVFIAVSVFGANHYVSPVGSNSNTGDTPLDAWATIDHGDNTGQVQFGDTVFIMSGRYETSTGYVLDAPGTEASHIVYTALGRDPVILDGRNAATYVLTVNGSYTEVHNLEITGAVEDGVQLRSAGGAFTGCYVHHCGSDGILLNETYTVFRRNISVSNGESGLRIDGFGDDSHIYGNTFCFNGQHGVYSTSATSNIYIANNILCGNAGYAVEGNATIYCLYNLVWENVEGLFHYCSDSGGNIIANPQFVDADRARFDLRHTSAAVDAGKVLDYEYNGAAPDIGAIEKYNCYYVKPGGDDSADGRSVESAWRTIDNGDTYLLPGDTVWVLPGTYTDIVGISDTGLADDYICYCGVRDSTFIDGTGHMSAVVVAADYVYWSGFVVYNSESSNMFIAGDYSRIENCLIRNSTYYGLNINATNNTVHGNVFTGNIGFSVLAGGKHTRVYNNVFYRNLDRDISCMSTDSAIIRNNIFIAGDPSENAVGGTETSQLSHSIFFGYETPLTGTISMGTGCLVTDPRLMDPDENNFHPLAESPSVDAGFVVGYPYNGYGPDIGAYETGIPAHMFVEDNHDTLLADETYAFITVTYDSLGFPTRPGPVVWSHTFETGDISATGVFTPQLVGSGKVVAQAPAYGLLDTSAALIVIPGGLHDLEIDPRAGLLQVGSSIQFDLAGQDIKDNPVSELGNITWDVFNGVGTVDQNGLFTATHVGYGIIRATSNLGPSILTDTITVTAGEPRVCVASLPLPVKQVVPGGSTGPVLAMEFVNEHYTGVSLDSVRLRFTGIDPDGATREELDSQIQSVALYLERDYQYATLSDYDSLLCLAEVSDGYAMMRTEELYIQPNGGSIKITVVAQLDAQTTKNENTIAFSLTDETDIYLSEAIPIAADFPLDNDVAYTVNTFPANLVDINDIPMSTLHEGQTNRLVLDFDLPSNGYFEDYLSSVRLVNLGSYEDNGLVLHVALWADVGGDGFTADDMNLGSLSYFAGFWQIANLSYPLSLYSTRFFVTVDIIGGQYDGGTLDFSIPIKGIQYVSGADGPDDAPLRSPVSFAIMPADRVTAVSVPKTSTTVMPGSAGNTVLAFALYNGYSVSKRLLSIRFTNNSQTASTWQFVDSELGQVSLHFDANNNRIFDRDPAVASGYFNDGLLNLSPSGLTLPAESLCYFFVAVHLPVEGIIDSDSLAVIIDNVSNIVFEVVDGDVVSINGDMPLTSASYLVVDGSVRAQYSVGEVTSRSLTPGDTSVALLCITPAVNGDQYDTLMSLTLENAGTAGEADFEALQLWQDKNGDNLWQSSDSLIKSFSYTGSGWIAQSIGLATGPDPTCLLVIGDVAMGAMSGASFQAVIPQNGCQFTSGNDGPIDEPLESTAEFVISASGLRISAVPLSGSYSVGQEINVSAHVRNLLVAPMDSVYCEFVAVNNSSDSVVLGPLLIDPDETVEYVGSFTASLVGQEVWRIRAFSTAPVDSSVTVYTDEVRIDQAPSEISLSLLNSAPASVIRGQTNIFPLSITFEQVDTVSTLSSLRLDSILINVEDADGAPQDANTVFSRMVLATEDVNLVVANNMPASPVVCLRFSEPIIVIPGKQQLLSMLVDIDGSATATSFALAINSASDINIVDHNTLLAVPFIGEVAFPMVTASCRIDEPSHELAVSSQSILNDCVNLGQLSVGGLELSVRHPGSLGASQIQLTRMEMELVDDSQGTIDAYGIISGLRILKQQTVVGQLTSLQPGTTNLVVNFTAPPTLSPGETEQLRVEFDIRTSTTHDIFGVRINDSTAFTVRDLTSGSLITAASDLELATGNVFPILSGLAQVKTPASSPQICLTSILAEDVIGGTREVPLVEMVLMYPVGEDYSSLTAEEIVVRLYDSSGAFLNPRELFDQIGVSVNEAPITYNPFIELRDGFAVFHLGDEGISITPGDTSVVTLVADIEISTATENFKLTIQNDSALLLCDATDTSSHPAAVASASCPFAYPFESNLAYVYLQAGKPAVSTAVPAAQLAYPGQGSVQVMSVTFTYDSPVLLGDLVLNGLIGQVLERTPSALSEKSPGTVFDAVMLMLDDDTLAVDSAFAGDSVNLAIDGGLTISRGDSYELSLRCDIKDAAPLGNYMISLNDSSFCDLQDKNILTVLSPNLTGVSYPLLSAEISLVEANLQNSFTNYPNPFNPETGNGTTIGFVLPEDARVDIELFTITGKLVKQLAVDAFRSAGAHQQDSWDGRNGRGMTVIPGTYFCRLTANYLSGRSETFKRKIAVVR